MSDDAEVWVLYHNENCSKSRKVHELLSQSGRAYSVVNYLDTPPDAMQLRQLCAKGGFDFRQLVRFGEPVAQGLNLSADDTRTDEEWSALLHKHPVLIERPIVETSTHAVIGRPPEKVMSLWE